MAKYDVTVVGAGPNGLAAALTLQNLGLSVLLLEAKETIGGGMRTKELTLPGFLHDVCSAIHPMAALSPVFQQFPLDKYGFEFIHPDVYAAHPFDHAPAAALVHSVEETASTLGADKERYIKLFKPLTESWPAINTHVLGPLLKWPKHPLLLANFGLKSLRSAKGIADTYFKAEQARGLWAGLAAHSMIPLESFTSAAIGLVLGTAAHIKGWPLVRGGSQRLADALAAYFEDLGGVIQTGVTVRNLNDIPDSKAIVFDVGPAQLLDICGDRISGLYRQRLRRFKYGMGVFKVDWALKAPVPFTDPLCRKAGTVHLGGTLEEVARSEREVWNGEHPEKPFVLLAQQSLFDNERAPAGLHTGWAYCHVPNGSQVDMTARIEDQVERFAPGFKDLILERHVFNAADMQEYNPNYIGGDINGGVVNLTQLINRPLLARSPYRTSARGIYICSASTPPGGGVHGMCGYNAAQRVIKDLF